MCQASRRASDAFLERHRRSTGSPPPSLPRGYDEYVEASHGLSKLQGHQSSYRKISSDLQVAGARSPDQAPYHSKMKIRLQRPRGSKLLNVAAIRPAAAGGHQESAIGLSVTKGRASNATNWQQ